MAIYPFSAIVGQDLLKRALLVCAIAPSVGGVLIRGDKGSAKTTAARGLAELLPNIEVRAGCSFNCSLDNKADECEACNRESLPAELTVAAPFINLPLGATEDRVTGSIDLERAIKDGKRCLQPGLLASAHRGVLYIDEVNLLADHLVDVLLDVAATGVNNVQREGINCSHAARICLIGTMNEEEGYLRPQLNDRFGLSLQVLTPVDPGERAEVVRRRLSFESDADAFCKSWSSAQDTVRLSIENAQRLLPQVQLQETELLLIARICSELQISSLRADIVMAKTAKALAALEERVFVTAEDLQTAGQLVLLHRRRDNSVQSAAAQQEKLQQLIEEAGLPPSRGQNSDGNSEFTDSSESDALEDNPPEEHLSVSEKFSRPAQITLKGGESFGPRGKRLIALGGAAGRMTGAELNARPQNISLSATISHSLERNQGVVDIGLEDLHQNKFESKSGSLILLIVDASGSLSACRRIYAVQGAAISLLEDAYIRRDRVAVVVFRGQSAEIVLPPTRSVELAKAKLNQIQTGGRTPLTDALITAERIIATTKKRDKLTPLLVLLSDGRANVSVYSGRDPFEEALTVAKRLQLNNVPSLIVDTESTNSALRQMRLLAEAAGGEYLNLENLTSQSLTITIRQKLSSRDRESFR